MAFWTVPRSWPGETAFVVAGGPSVADLDLERLRGRRVIAVNSSCECVPFAEFLFFGDSRWYGHNAPRLGAWGGRLVTVANVTSSRVLRLHRGDVKEGLSTDPKRLVMGRTSLHAALNLATLLGARRIVLLGADMQAAADGRTHHHSAHPWPQKAGCWDEQIKFLEFVVEPLAAAGVEVLNASPVSRLPWWRKVPFDEVA